MILQALVQHYERLAEEEKVDREGWCKAKVSYGINLSPEGEIRGIITLKQEEERGKKKVWIPKQIKVPEMVTRSSGISANFLCDNSKYMLGLDENGTSQRVLECFAAAKERHLLLLKDTEGEMARAVRLFFETWDPMKAAECDAVREKQEEITDGGNLIFCMGMQYAQDDPYIKDIWEKSRMETSGEEQTGICLVTGQKTEISRIHKVIKGVPGAQSSGAALVSFNAPSFESYGKSRVIMLRWENMQSFAYTTALNYLLAQRDYTFQLGDSMIVFWAESAKEEYQAAFFDCVDPPKDNQEEIRGIFDHLKKQWKVEYEDVELNPDQKFYILSLAPNAARLSCVFFYQDSFGNILKNLAAHYDRMAIVRPAWANDWYLGIRSMLGETVNQNSKDKCRFPIWRLCIKSHSVGGKISDQSLYRCPDPYPSGAGDGYMGQNRYYKGIFDP